MDVLLLLSEVASELNKEGIETEIFWLGLKPISGCIACNKCSSLGKCVFNDAVNEFVEKVKTADGFVFGSPVHYAAASGAITSFMDRVFYSTFSNPSEVLARLSNSNSSEMYTFRRQLAQQLLKTNDPLENLNKIEEVFTKNNIPTVGKIYSCFEILHPDFYGFNFNNSKVSPVLKRSSTSVKK